MRILIIEDDTSLCKGMAYHLKKAGYTVDCCFDGADGLHFATQGAYELILLDRMLPTLDGLSLLQQLRSKQVITPVIMVTALSELQDKVNGLDAGADDYLPKPFEMDELLARIRAVTRRPNQLDATQTTLSFHDLSLNLSSLILSGPDTSYELSKREGLMAEVFLRSPNTVINRNMLLIKVWGPDAPVEEGNIDNYIHFLRRRLHTVGSNLQIKTLRGIGYRLEIKDA